MATFKGIVSAATPEAAQSGADILREGGNAVDAAVAVSLALGVTEPAGSGIGGQGTMIVQRPNNVGFVINGTSLAPPELPADLKLTDLKGRRASTVPSMLRMLDFVHKNYGSGTIPWQRLVEPAIHYAYKGYPLGEFRRKSMLRYRKALLKNSTARELLFTSEGTVPEVGSCMKNHRLASTLKRIGSKGAEEFYSGKMAEQISEDMAVQNGWVKRANLRDIPAPKVLPALKGYYRDYDIATLPPPASGWAVLMALNILSQVPPEKLSQEGPCRTAWIVQALKVAHRHRLMRPIQDLIHYDDQVQNKLSTSRAEKIAASLRDEGTGETTHFSIVDKDGMAVGVTQSLNSYFGSKIAHPDLGFFYNSYMIEFVSPLRNSPFALRPNAMPYSSMSASILAQESRPLMVVGSPANDRIISAVVQVISNWLDLKQTIQTAIEKPRLHTIREEEVMMEVRPSSATLLALEELGFSVHAPFTSLFAGKLNPYFGGVHAIAFEENGWIGVADPRRDGAVVYAD